MRILFVFALLFACAFARSQMLQSVTNNRAAVASGPAALLHNYQGGTDNAPDSATTLTNPSLIFGLKDPLTSGACMGFAFLYASNAYTPGTISDSLGNTIHAGPSQVSGNFTLQSEYILGATAGFDTITVPFTGSSNTNTSFSPWETGVISCSTATIGGTGSTSFTANGSAHNLTLSGAPSSGDFVLYYAVDISSPASIATAPFTNAITVGSGYTLLSTVPGYGKMAQYCLTCTSTAVPVTYAGTDTIVAVAMVFKQGASGAAPATGQRIINYQVVPYGTAGAHATPFPCPGCTLIAGLVTSPDGHVSAATSSGYTSTWAGFTLNTNYAVQNSVASVAQIFYGPSGSSGTASASITPTFASASAGFLEIAYAGITGASTFDNAHTTNNINQTTSGNLTADVITPATAGDLCFNVATLDFSTISGTVADANGHTPLLLQAVDTLGNNNTGAGGTGASTLDEDDGRTVIFGVTATALTAKYSFTAGNIGTSLQDVSVSACFK